MTNIYNEQFYGYESVEFNLTTGQLDYSLVTNQQAASGGNFNTYFGNSHAGDASGGRESTRVQIRTNQTISIKLNSTANNAITISSTDSPVTIDGVKITDIFFTNSSGSTAAVKLLLTDNPN